MGDVLVVLIHIVAGCAAGWFVVALITRGFQGTRLQQAIYYSRFGYWLRRFGSDVNKRGACVSVIDAERIRIDLSPAAYEVVTGNRGSDR